MKRTVDDAHRRVANFGYDDFGYGNFGYGNFGFGIRFLDFGYGVLDTVLDTVLDILNIFLDILDTVLDTAKFWIRPTCIRCVSKKIIFWIRFGFARRYAVFFCDCESKKFWIRLLGNGRPTDVPRTSHGRPTDVRRTSDRRPTDVRLCQLLGSFCSR